METYQIIIIAALVAASMFWSVAKKKKLENDINSWLVSKGMQLTYNYHNTLGIDTNSGRIFVYTDAAYLLNRDQVRSVEKSSIHESKYNVYGMGFHKDKNCQLVIHTTSVESPLHVIGFEDKKEMDIWYSRIGAFYSLS